MKTLTDKEERFCLLMLEAKGRGKGLAEAYRGAGYDCSKLKPNTLHRRASELNAKAHVQARLQKLRSDAADAVVFKVVDVLKHWIAIATADPNDIIQHRRGACRFCYGINGQYQWVSKTEFSAARARAVDKGRTLPSSDGGFGYNHNEEPNAQCTECHGDGVEYVHVADTRRLTGNAKLLYAGVKKTKDGVEIKMRDQDAALINIAKHLGMLKNKVEIVQPPKGNEPPPDIMGLDVTVAAQLYEKYINGA